MKNKIDELIIIYKTKKERKERLIEPLIIKRSNGYDLNEKENIDYHRIKSEIELLDRFIIDLNYLIE